MMPSSPRLRLPTLRRRAAIRLATLASAGVVGAWLAACTGQTRPVETSKSGAAAPGQAPTSTAQAGRFLGVLPNSDVAVGSNVRFLLGLLDDGNRPVTDARVQLKFFKLLDETTGQLRVEAPAIFRGSPQLGDRGLYVARTEFDEPGKWGVGVSAQRPGEGAQTLRLTFDVKPRSQTPSIGRPAPASATPTAATPAEAEGICSARPADAFHRLSLAQALAERKPLVVLFATPAFCTTRTCGPSLEVVQLATAAYADRVNVVHVEIYKDGRPPDLLPAVAEWSLPSEPWVFLVGADGAIVDKYEGGVTTDELGPAIAQLAGA
jgi:hypothetical protein